MGIIKNKKASMLIMSLVMLSTVFTGCGSKMTSTTVTTETVETSLSAEKEMTPERTEETKWYVADEPVEIRVFFRDRTDFPISSEMPVFKTIEEKTNVRFKWEVAPWDNPNEKFNLIMASNDLPDLFIHTYARLNDYVNKGAFAPINDILDEAAPNLKEVLDSDPVYTKELTALDGNIYTIPMLSAIKNEKQYMIRKDWLDKLDLEVPVTLEDWVNVMTAFRDRDPNGNGIKDEIPYTFTNGFRGANLYESFGVDYSLNHEVFFLEGDEIKYGASDPRMKDYLEFANMLYKEKLIDPEYLTVDTKLWESRMINSTSGITFGFGSRIDRFNGELQKEDPNAELIGILPPVGPMGKAQTRRQLTPVRSEGAANIAVSSKYKKEIVKMFDYIYSEEGQMLLNFGIEGEHYNIVEGKPQYTELITKNPEGLSPSNALKKYGINLDFPFKQDAAYEGAFVSEEVNRSRKEYEPCILPSMPKFKLTDEELGIVNPILSEVTTYSDEWLDKFVLGTEPISKFEQFVEQLNKMGIDKVLDIYNQAYQRYNQQ